MKASIKDTRHRCKFCSAVTWQKDYAAFMGEHDRPEGGRCLRAAKVYSKEIYVPVWAQSKK